jgi:hypothetical protein
VIYKKNHKLTFNYIFSINYFDINIHFLKQNKIFK